MFRIKSIIKKILSMLGIGIYRISANKSKVSNAQGLVINGPIYHNSLERLNELYSDQEIVKRYINPKRVAFYHEVINFLLDKGVTFNHRNVVDIGCGTGHILKFIDEKFKVANLIGFEYSNAAINVAKMICPKATFFQFDIYEGTSQQFDVLFCTEVLEHLLFPDKALKNCVKMIAKEGILLITVPNGRVDTFLGHINFWSPESWKVFIGTNCKGFQCDIGITKNGTNYAIIRRKN